METEEFKKSEISKWKKYKWAIQDVAGLQLYRIIAFFSRDPKVSELYQEMRKAIYEEGNQPKALRIGNEIKSKVIMNTQEMVN
jgi:hypothetical protein